MDNQYKNNEDTAPLSPEEIKAIGEIEIGPAKHEVFLNNHYKKLIVGGLALVAVASAAICYATYVQQRDEDAGAAMVSAMKVTAPGHVATPDAYDATQLATVVGDYAPTPSAPTAELMEGLSLLSAEGDKQQTGISRLEQLAANSPDTLICSRARAALAAHYMRNGENEKSAAEWSNIIRLPQNPYSALAYLSLGDLAKQKGDIEGARSYYKQIATACPNSPLARQGAAELRLMLLGVDAPKQETPAPKPQAPAATPFNPFGAPTAAPASGADFSFPSTSTMPGSGN